jgi:hypothetical protein
VHTNSGATSPGTLAGNASFPVTDELVRSTDVASMWQPFDLAIRIDQSSEPEDVLTFLATKSLIVRYRGGRNPGYKAVQRRPEFKAPTTGDDRSSRH